jgi:hypothetical protein
MAQDILLSMNLSHNINVGSYQLVAPGKSNEIDNVYILTIKDATVEICTKL